jgi:outer membrane protein OmpA-like peptidoglycan-associated protein
VIKYKFNAIALACALGLGLVPVAMGVSGQRVGGYDFAYMTTGEQRATPVQVFDDGKSTYFQFRAGEPIPAIFQNRADSVQLLVPVFEGPYVKINDVVAGRFTLQLGRAQAQVVYSAGGRAGSPKLSAVGPNGVPMVTRGGYPADQNTKLVASLGQAMEYLNSGNLDTNSYATPVKGDRVVWQDAEVKTDTVQVWFPKGQGWLGQNAKRDVGNLAMKVRNATSITIVGRDDDSYKEGLDQARGRAIKDLLVKSGVPAQLITLKTGVAGDPEKGLWASDIRIETAAPTQVARREPGEMPAHLRSNVLELMRANVLTPDQAQALLRRQDDQAGRGVQQSAAAIAAAEPHREPAKPKLIEVPSGGFDFKAGDRTISNTLRRWGQATSYEVLWKAPISSDAVVNGDGQLTAGSMKEAIEKVVTGLQRKGYELNATIYSNRVIVLTGNAK